MGRPKDYKGGRKLSTFSIPEKLQKKFKEVCKDLDVSQSDVIQRAMLRFIQKYQPSYDYED